MDKTFYYDEIEKKIYNYKNSSYKLKKDKLRLQEVLAKLKELRKNVSKGVNEEILSLNSEHSFLKQEISALKKTVQSEYDSAEKMIFDGISNNYSDVFDVQLSKLYGYKMEVVVKNMGDDFDERTCLADFMIITKDKKQHAKVIRMLDFGLVETDANYVVKKAKVEMCVYSKKLMAGSVIPFDYEMLYKGLK